MARPVPVRGGAVFCFAETLKAKAADEHLPTSALIRGILARAVREGTAPVLTVEQVEEIARRVCEPA